MCSLCQETSHENFRKMHVCCCIRRPVYLLEDFVLSLLSPLISSRLVILSVRRLNSWNVLELPGFCFAYLDGSPFSSQMFQLFNVFFLCGTFINAQCTSFSLFEVCGCQCRFTPALVGRSTGMECLFSFFCFLSFCLWFQRQALQTWGLGFYPFLQSILYLFVNWDV